MNYEGAMQAVQVYPPKTSIYGQPKGDVPRTTLELKRPHPLRTSKPLQ